MVSRPARRSRTAPGDERFRALFGNAPVGVALCDPDGDFCDVNATFREKTSKSDGGDFTTAPRHDHDTDVVSPKF